jgi:hypothetical protein
MTSLVAPAHRRLIVAAIVFAASATPVAAQGRSHYRTYAMGDSLLAISRQIGLPVIDDATTPAVPGAVQELRWHARFVRRGTAPSGDPVDRLVFSFYEHRLFRIVIDYAPDRTDGMTESDMVGAVSALYGPPIRRTLTSNQDGTAPLRPAETLIAEWTSGDQSGLEFHELFDIHCLSESRPEIAAAAGARLLENALATGAAEPPRVAPSAAATRTANAARNAARLHDASIDSGFGARYVARHRGPGHVGG